MATPKEYEKLLEERDVGFQKLMKENIVLKKKVEWLEQNTLTRGDIVGLQRRPKTSENTSTH